MNQKRQKVSFINKNSRTLSPRGNYEQLRPPLLPEPENSYDLRTQPTSAVPGTRRDVPKDARNVVTEEQFFLQFNYGKNVEQNEKDIAALENQINAANTDSRIFNAGDYTDLTDAINNFRYFAEDCRGEKNEDVDFFYTTLLNRLNTACGAGAGNFISEVRDLAAIDSTAGEPDPPQSQAALVAVAFNVLNTPPAPGTNAHNSILAVRLLIEPDGIQARALILALRSLDATGLRPDPQALIVLNDIDTALTDVRGRVPDLFDLRNLANFKVDIENFIAVCGRGNLGDAAAARDRIRQILFDAGADGGENIALVPGDTIAIMVQHAVALRELLTSIIEVKSQVADNIITGHIDTYFGTVRDALDEFQNYLDAKKLYLEEVSRPLVTQKNALIEKQYDAGKRRKSKKRKSRRKSATKRRSSSKRRSATKRRSSSKRRSATRRRSSRRRRSATRRRSSSSKKRSRKY